MFGRLGYEHNDSEDWNKFEDILEGQAPDVASDSQGNIYALDFDRKVLRVFEKK